MTPEEWDLFLELVRWADDGGFIPNDDTAAEPADAPQVSAAEPGVEPSSSSKG